ncbi:hypothetical protein OUZ56_010513 [Daphnia magna]|uniref:Uncharacterized protein n=1 Tax=Daphnia magna TaxID=35525 RepID=A0ABR0AIR2_9CRUS|nr:hypothetical protein OUZ56_010513 [Daphnia magna]
MTEVLENDPLGDEERPSTSSGLPKPQLKKTGFPESVMQPKSDQNNNDSTTKDGQGSTKDVKRNSIDDSRPNSKRRKKNPVLAADEKIDSALIAMGSFFSSRITQVPETIVLPEVPTNPVYSDWLAYCSTYAKRVASISDVGKRDDIRYEMEGILYQHLKSYNANKTT